MPTNLTAHAIARFGLGAQPGEWQQVGFDAKGWLLQQLAHPALPGSLRPSDELTCLIRKDADGKPAMTDDSHGLHVKLRDAYTGSMVARLNEHSESTQPFIERLVMFWSNHFTVSTQKPIISGIVGRYEYEAIRPFVTGYFRDMLLAVARHPAMLLYLDNAQSIGPDSRPGMRRGKGLNENLAREVMELHTLGVNGGYTQADVTEFAKILTGWGLAKAEDDIIPLQFQFHEQVHEPGDKMLLGRRFREDGEQEGIDALTMLAQHPATARHLATKLARHFISDNPPQEAIAQLADSYLRNNGHLGMMMQTLIDLPQCWEYPLAKMKNPYEYLVASLRMAQVNVPPPFLISSFAALNFRPFNADSPAGEPDTVADWAAPDAIMKRIEWAHRFALHMPGGSDPKALAQVAFNDTVSDSTMQTIQRAASGKDGIAFLLSSPEFMRR